MLFLVKPAENTKKLQQYNNNINTNTILHITLLLLFYFPFVGLSFVHKSLNKKEYKNKAKTLEI